MNIFDGTKQTFDIRNFDGEAYKTALECCYFSLKDYVVSVDDLKNAISKNKLLKKDTTLEFLTRSEENE